MFYGVFSVFLVSLTPGAAGKLGWGRPARPSLLWMAVADTIWAEDMAAMLWSALSFTLWSYSGTGKRLQPEQAISFVCVCVCICNAVRDAAETAIDRTHTLHAETGKGAGMRSIHQRANSAQFHTVPNNISALDPKIKPVEDLYKDKDSSTCVGRSLRGVIQNRFALLKCTYFKKEKSSSDQTETCTLNHYKEKTHPFMRSSLFSCKCLTVDVKARGTLVHYQGDRAQPGVLYRH